MSKLTKDIDFSFETERLFIRLLQEQDRAFFVALHTDEKIMKHNGGKVDNELANKKFNTAIKYNKKSSLDFKILAIVDKKSGSLLGLIFVFQSEKHRKENSIEAGIILNRLSHGKRLPEEAISALLTYLFNQIDIQQIIGSFHKENLATKRFVTKLGFNSYKFIEETNFYCIYFDKSDWLRKHKNSTLY